jgi:hypothetical protein
MNKFNRILLASGLAATASLVANSPAFADTTGTVNLSGTVPSTLAVTVSPSPDAFSLDLSPGTRIVKIATITGAATNSPSGLKVTATSNWRLVSGSNFIVLDRLGESQGSNATSPTSLQLPSYYDSNPLQLTTSDSTGNASDSSIFVSYTIPPDQAPGTYTGSITFTATDN